MPLKTYIVHCLGLVAGFAVILSTVSSSQGQVVQLPSVRTFSSSGSVLVPDAGTAALGGTRYGRSGSTRSGGGLSSGRALSSQSGGSSLSVSVQIIDLQALDEAILASTASSTNFGSQPIPAQSAIEPAWPPQSATSQRVNADPGAWQRALAGATRAPDRLTSNDPGLAESDLRYYMKRADEAEKAGSLQAARVYHRLARQAMTPELTARYQDILNKRNAAAASDAPAAPTPDSRQF